MSSNPKCRHSNNEIHLNSEKESCFCVMEEKKNNKLSHFVDYVNNNNLNVFYPKEESLFKKRIDKLNLKFYIETEKYLSNKNDMNKCHDQLFLILFKQISLYIEEIERLNCILKDRRENQNLQEKIDEISTKQKELDYSQILINTLRTSNYQLEKKLAEKAQLEAKIKAENESLKRQNKFYKEKLKVEIAYGKLHSEINNEYLVNNGGEIFQSFRSGSKDSGKKMRMSRTSRELANRTKSNNKDIMISENPIFAFTTNDINKKQKCFDNNPNLITKIHSEINHNVNSPENNRYINGSSVERVNKLEKKGSRNLLGIPTSEGCDCNGGRGNINELRTDLLGASHSNANLKSNQIPNLGHISSPQDLHTTTGKKFPKGKTCKRLIFTNCKKNMIDPKTKTKANSFNIIQQDFKIIKTVKQQIAGKTTCEEKNAKGLSQMKTSSESLAHNINPANSSIGNCEISLQDSYFSSYIAFDSELNELTEIERLLRSMRTYLGSVESSNEVENQIKSNGHNDLTYSPSSNGMKSGGMLSDEDIEVYGSYHSCENDNTTISHPDALVMAKSDENIINRINKSSSTKYPMLTSITIDLGKTLVSTDEEKKNNITTRSSINKRKRCVMNTLGALNSYNSSLNSTQGMTKKF